MHPLLSRADFGPYRYLRTNPFLLCLLALLGFTTTHAAAVSVPADAEVVAMVGGDLITAAQFGSRYAEHLRRSGLEDSPLLRTHFLQGLVEERLLARDAIASGLNDEPAYRVEAERYRRKLLLDLYTRRTVYEGISVEESDLRTAFTRINTRLAARHLYARSLEDARDLHDRLMAGATFEALARETFADSALAASGGYVGYFTFDEMDAGFEDAAFALEVGDVSEPVRTAQGYSIIRLEDRQTEPLLTETDYATRRNHLISYVTNRKRAAARLAHVRAIASALDLRFDPASLADLHRQIEGTFLMPGDEALGAWLASPLLSFTREGRRITWSIEDFRREAQFTDVDHRAQVRSHEELVEFVEGIVVREVMLDRARDAGFDENPLLDVALEEWMTSWFASAARRRVAARYPDAEAAAGAVERHLETLRSRYQVRVRLDTLASLSFGEPTSS